MCPTNHDKPTVLGALRPELAAAKLRAMGELEAAVALEAAAKEEILSFGPADSLWPFQDRPWQHTAHAFGYLPPGLRSQDPIPLRFAGQVEPDPSLKGVPIKITLDRMRVESYPGHSPHLVMFEFGAVTVMGGHGQQVAFNMAARSAEGGMAAVLGFPIFLGLTVPAEGVGFHCRTINVKSEGDEALLQVLASPLFTGGLDLLAASQPMLAPLTGLVGGVAHVLAARSRNVVVQEFHLGLDFSQNVTRAHLAEGSFIAAQIPQEQEAGWDWGQWVLHPRNGQIVDRATNKQPLPYNYVVFSVSRMEPPPGDEGPFVVPADLLEG